VKITNSTGTATASDLGSFRVVFDANSNGVYDAGTESVVSDTNALSGGTVTFAMSGQGAITGIRRYLVIADVATNATAERTFTGAIAAPGDVTTTGAAGQNYTDAVALGATNVLLTSGAGTVFFGVPVNARLQGAECGCRG
jgi:hypothetical protein